MILTSFCTFMCIISYTNSQNTSYPPSQDAPSEKLEIHPEPHPSNTPNISSKNVLCLCNPCLNNGSCISMSSWTDYNCNCSDEFEGKNCEKFKTWKIVKISSSMILIAGILAVLAMMAILAMYFGYLYLSRL